MLTKPQRDEIRARADAATRGPWRSEKAINQPLCDYREIRADGGYIVAVNDFIPGPQIPLDFDFISAARDDVPALLDALDEMERFLGVPMGHVCVICDAPIFGAMRGMGDGSGQKFACEACYWRKEAEQLERERNEARRALVSVDSVLSDCAELNPLRDALNGVAQKGFSHILVADGNALSGLYEIQRVTRVEKPDDADRDLALCRAKLRTYAYAPPCRECPECHRTRGDVHTATCTLALALGEKRDAR